MSHPSQPEFWEQRYTAGTTPWDLGGVPARLRRYLEEHPAGGRVLIPGCGSGHEISAFYDAGYTVTAIDFAPAAAAQARANVGPALADRVLLGDYFTQDFSDAPFDLVYERTFFCALPPGLRSDCVRRAAQLLRPGGSLVGLFYLGDEEGGPPYALRAADERTLFGPHFILVRDEPVAQQFHLFGDKERWREYRRKDFAPATQA